MKNDIFNIDDFKMWKQRNHKQLKNRVVDDKLHIMRKLYEKWMNLKTEK